MFLQSFLLPTSYVVALAFEPHHSQPSLQSFINSNSIWLVYIWLQNWAGVTGLWNHIIEWLHPLAPPCNNSKLLATTWWLLLTVLSQWRNDRNIASRPLSVTGTCSVLYETEATSYHKRVIMQQVSIDCVNYRQPWCERIYSQGAGNLLHGPENTIKSL